ncbi:hypothetical protein [Amycolatopsis arida]|nr:hypothetical protein [Amycolatopsis arida]
MNMVETILVFVLIPLALYGVISLATLRSKFAGAPRYRPGQPWEYPPQWWSANPDGVSHQRVGDEASGATTDGTVKGGARGTW